LKKDRFVVGDTSPKLCRWLWIQWAAKILGWRGRHPKVQADAFGAEIHEALHVKIYPLPKVKRDVDRVPVPPPRAELPCTENVAGVAWKSTNAERDADAAIQTGWLEFFQHRGYVDKTNNIKWAANPAATLSGFSYGNLLVVTGATNPVAPSVPGGEACRSIRMAGDSDSSCSAGNNRAWSTSHPAADWAATSSLPRSASSAFHTPPTHAQSNRVAHGSQPLHTREMTTVWRTWRIVLPAIAPISRLASPSAAIEAGVNFAERTSSPTLSARAAATTTHSVTLSMQVSTPPLPKPTGHRYVSYPTPKIHEAIGGMWLAREPRAGSGEQGAGSRDKESGEQGLS
jgi:hypothetical protein